MDNQCLYIAKGVFERIWLLFYITIQHLVCNVNVSSLKDTPTGW